MVCNILKENNKQTQISDFYLEYIHIILIFKVHVKINNKVYIVSGLLSVK